MAVLGPGAIGVTPVFAAETYAAAMVSRGLSAGTYRAAVARTRKTPRLRDGEFSGWIENTLLTQVACVAPDRHRVDLIFPDAHIPGGGGKKKPVDPQQRFLISPAEVAFLAVWSSSAFRFDLRRMAEVQGEGAARKQFVDFVSEADPVFWPRTLDVETAKVVEQKEMPLEGQDEDDDEDARRTETLYVIEGTPAELSLLAEVEERKDLPIEPLLQITVGEDGFPRHVLVQCYCPKWDVLELTVTDYELNPDLPDDLFDFTPPEGVQFIEADPANWRD
jgi:hypothetical protein